MDENLPTERAEASPEQSDKKQAKGRFPAEVVDEPEEEEEEQRPETD